MDPLSGLAIAGAAVQFIDFGAKFTTKFVTQSHSLYRSVRNLEEERYLMNYDEESWNDAKAQWKTAQGVFESDAQTLLLLTEKIQKPSDEISNGPEDAQLLALCQSCGSVAGEMVTHVQSLKLDLPNFRKIEAESEMELRAGKRNARFVFQDEKRQILKMMEIFRKALKAVMTEDRMREIHSRLSTLRQSLELYILVDIKQKQDAAILASSNRFNQLDAETKQLLLTLLDSNRSLAADMKDQALAVTQVLYSLDQVVLNQAAYSHQERHSVQEIDASQYVDHSWKAAPPEGKLREATDAAILQELAFASMVHREQAIPKAHSRTFDWIFSPTYSEDVPWDNFASWLQNEQTSGVYWVSGKAGSGKSTLMRYIHQQSQLLSLVSAWAHPLQPTLATHFFWNSGTNDQKSQAGLLRKLIFEVLNKHRNLIAKFMPGRWAKKCSELAGLSVDASPSYWSLSDLSLVFQRIVTQKDEPMKLFLLIDGLDEFEGEHDILATLFRDITVPENVKACVSSRPLLAFEDHFESCPKLRLQDLTHGDIAMFVADQLREQPRFKELVKQEPARAPALVEEIVTKASGVFLWVVLVVRSLCSGLGNRDSIADLQRRLRALPADLESLYTHMLSSIDPFYQRKASEMFQLLRASEEVHDNFGRTEDYESESLTALAMSFAEDEDPDLALNCPIGISNKMAIEQRCNVLSARLKVRCAGLLEIQGVSRSGGPVDDQHIRVQYLHRTVRDYLERDDIWARLLELTADTGFSPHLNMLKSHIIRLKVLQVSLWQIFHTAMVHAHCADELGQNPRMLTELINCLDTTLKARWKGLKLEQTDSWIDDPIVVRAIRYGCSGYVDDTLSGGRQGRQPRYYKDRQYLDYAVVPGMWDRHFPVSVKMVTVLLQQGANPNKDANGPWQNLLLSLWENRRAPVAKSRKNTKTRMLQWLEICELLVRHGAKNDKAIKTSGGTKWPSEIVSEVFMDYFPERTRAFRQIVDAGMRPKRESMRKSWFPWS